LSYSLRYRTDKDKNKFNNYLIDDKINIKEKNVEDNTIEVYLTIPTVKDNKTSKVISADYYLKIYNHSKNDLLINNTISIIDNLEPYQIIEFTTNAATYNQKIQIPNDNNEYYILVNAITSDRELLSYDSLMIKEGESKEESKGKFAELLKWYWILLIVLGALLLILIIFLIVRCVRKKKRNNIQVVETMIPLCI